jgi:hypothetical protein
LRGARLAISIQVLAVGFQQELAVGFQQERKADG